MNKCFFMRAKDEKSYTGLIISNYDSNDTNPLLPLLSQEFPDWPIDKIKSYMPSCTLSTDIIVGFPGETDQDFKDTLDIVSNVQFNSSFMFKYSSRPGTKAAEYSDQIPETVKQERLEELIKLQKEITHEVNSSYIGKELHVIVEKESKKSNDQWAGRTEGNTWVIFDKMNFKLKDTVTLRIHDAQGVTLFGTPVVS